MKRKNTPKPPIPALADPLIRLGQIGRGIVFGHLLLTPLLFSQATVEGFEFVKSLVLIATVLLLLVLATLALPHVAWDDVKRELGHPLTLAGMAFVGSALISTIASTDWHTSLYGHHENQTGFITTLAYFLLFAAAQVLIRTPRQMRSMLLAVAIAAIGVTAYGLVQAARLDPLAWARLSVVNGFVRPFSTFGHANFLGAWLVLALPPVILLARGGARFALLPLAALMSLLLVLTMSRGAWLGMVGCAVAALIYRPRAPVALAQTSERGPLIRRRAALAAVFGLVAVTIAVIVTSGVLRTAIAARTERLLDDAGRGDIWSASIRIFFERPLIGTGPDTLHHHFGRHKGTDFWDHSWGFTPTRAHNEFLHVLATQGALGALTLLGVLAALIWSIRQAWRRNADQRGLVAAITAALCGFAITEIFGFTVIACGSLTAVLGAMLARLTGTPQALKKPRTASQTVLPWRFAQAALIAGCGFLLVHLVTDPLRADSWSSSAERAQSPTEALRDYQNAARICPRSPLYWNRLAAHAENCGRWEANISSREHFYRIARHGYSEAAAREPGNGYHRAGLARAIAELARLGHADPKDAYRAFDSALRLDPGVAYFYVDASQAALQLSDGARAETYIRAGLERYPEYGAMRRQAAMLLLLHNRPVEAVPEFDRALAADWKGEVTEREITARIRAEVIRRMGREQP